jgi:hypothetical protein
MCYCSLILSYIKNCRASMNNEFFNLRFFFGPGILVIVFRRWCVSELEGVESGWWCGRSTRLRDRFGSSRPLLSADWCACAMKGCGILKAWAERREGLSLRPSPSSSALKKRQVSLAELQIRKFWIFSNKSSSGNLTTCSESRSMEAWNMVLGVIKNSE